MSLGVPTCLLWSSFSGSLPQQTVFSAVQNLNFWNAKMSVTVFIRMSTSKKCAPFAYLSPMQLRQICTCLQCNWDKYVLVSNAIETNMSKESRFWTSPRRRPKANPALQAPRWTWRLRRGMLTWALRLIWSRMPRLICQAQCKRLLRARPPVCVCLCLYYYMCVCVYVYIYIYIYICIRW